MAQKSILLAAAMLATIATPVIAQAGDPVGYVERKRGTAGEEVWIQRDGKKVRAVPGSPVYAGDRVHVRGTNNYAQLLLAGHNGVATVRAGSSFSVKAAPVQSWSNRLGQFVSNVGNALGITDRVTSSGTYTRSAPVLEAGETATAEVLSRVPALDTSTLYAVPDLDALALRWCGDAIDVQAFSADGLELTSAEEQNVGFGSVDLGRFIDFDLNSGAEYPADTVRIRPFAASDSDLKYQLKWIGLEDVPRPQPLKSVEEPSAADKVEWANWLIEDENGTLGNQYNLIAFSFLAEARNEIWVAGYMLERASYCPPRQQSS